MPSGLHNSVDITHSNTHMLDHRHTAAGLSGVSVCISCFVKNVQSGLSIKLAKNIRLRRGQIQFFTGNIREVQHDLCKKYIIFSG